MKLLLTRDAWIGAELHKAGAEIDVDAETASHLIGADAAEPAAKAKAKAKGYAPDHPHLAPPIKPGGGESLQS